MQAVSLHAGRSPRDRAARAPEQKTLRAHVEAERRYVQDIQDLHGKERRG